MVAMNVWPTDAADGSVSSEARWRKMARTWARSGVVFGQGGNLQPTLAYPNLTVRSGAAWVDGHYCELAGDQVLTVTANGLTVVRFDPAANTAELLYRDGVSVPAQSPTGTWELPIAAIAGSAMTDRRVDAAATQVEQATYTPTLGNMSIGSGGGAQNLARYAFVGGSLSGDYGVLSLRGHIQFGTTGATFPAAGSELISLPPGFSHASPTGANLMPVGRATYNGASNAAGSLWASGSSDLRPVAEIISGSNVIFADLSGTSPFAWAAGNSIIWAATVLALRN